MKTKLYLFILFLAAVSARAQTNNLATLLQQGLFEEQANRNLDAAIADYQSVAGQFDKDRKIAATAVFRLGECLRTKGETNEAAAQYQRVLREFSDQSALVTLSRQNLAGMCMAGAPAGQTTTFTVKSAENEEDKIIQQIREMIQNSPDLINATAGKVPPLIDAVMSDHPRVAAFLLDNGANVELKNSQGETPLILAAKNGHKAMVDLLLSRGANVNSKDANDSTALHLAASCGFQSVVELLLANKADVNARGQYNWTPLDRACDKKQTDIIRMLLAAGADPNFETHEGTTPLSLIVGRDGSMEAVKMLLDAKADLKGSKVDALLLSAVGRNNKALAELFLKNGANPNATGKVYMRMDMRTPSGKRADPSYAVASIESPVTPLWVAVQSGQLPMVNLLLKFKADPNDTCRPSLSYPGGNGLPPLDTALNHPDILEALLDAGGNANFHDENGFSLLHLAALDMASKKTFELLLDHHADPNVKDNEGMTPLDLLKAKDPAVPEVQFLAKPLMDFLRQHGALDRLPHWDSIELSKPSSHFSKTVLKKSTNDWNCFTLLEAIASVYIGGPNTQSPGAFPDFTRVVILRPTRNSTNETRLTVNILDNKDGIDCSKDIPLEFGDVIEISERDHALGEAPFGLTGEQLGTLCSCVTRKVHLFTRHQKIELELVRPPSWGIANALYEPDARKVLHLSSDLSRVKVSRRDSATGKTQEWTMDCSNPQSAPCFLLRDGDVVEVLDKQP